MKKLDCFHQWALLCLFTAFVGLSPFNAHAIAPLSDIDLELSISSENPTNYTAFTHNTFTIILKNKGTVDATGVNVHIPFPSNQLAYTSSNASTGSGSYNLFSNTWNVGTLAPNATATLDLKLFVLDTSNDITLFAQVQSANETDADSMPGNDTNQTADEDDEASITLSSATTIDLELNAEFSVPTADAGQGVSLFLTIINKGSAIAENVTVSFDFSSLDNYGILYEELSQGSYGSEGWNVGTLASGQTASFIFVGTAGLITEPIVFFAQVQTATPMDIDSTPGNDFDQTPNEDDEALATLSALGTTPMSDLSLIVPSGGPLNIGDFHTFSVNIFNDGPDAATNITIADILPSAFSLQNSSPTQGDYTAGLWNVGDLASGEGATLTLGVLVGDFSGTLAYFAQIQTSDSNDPDSTLGNDTDQTPNEDDEASISYIYIPPLSADLELSILHFDITVVPTAAEYDLIVEIKNNGPETATGIVVSSILPNNIFSLSDPSVSQGTYDNDDWIVGDLASGESAGLSFYGFIDEFDTPNFYFAQIQTASPNDLDSTPGNDTNQTADEDDEVWVDFTVLAAADLHLSILDGGGTVNEGEVHTLKLRVSNAGPQEATGVSIADILPNELTIQGVTATQGSYDNGLWNVGDLDFYEDAFLDIEVLVGDFSGTFEYFAQIQTSDQYDPNSTPGDNTTGIPNEGDEAKIDFIPESTPQADLSLTAAFDVANAELGDGVKITLKITNDGPATATNIIVSDVTPNALLIIAPTVSKGTYDGDWSIGELASGESATIVFNGIVEIFENPIIYFAQVKSVDQDDPDSTPNSDTAQLPLEDDEALAVLTVIPPFQSADLSLTVPSGGVLNIGDVHTFSVNVFNDGPDVATNVTIADILPSAFILQNSTPTQGDYTAGLWNVGDLASGEGATLKLEVLVGDFTGTLTYFAQVQTSDSNDPNSIPGNDTDQTPNEDDEATISYIYIPTGTDIDLELNISSNVGEFNLYENVTYTIEVTNNGPANASGVQVATAVPAGMAFTSKTASKGSYNLWAGVWTVGDLANGETATLEVVTFTLNNSASITNFAQVKAAQQDDSDSTPNSNNTGVPVEDDEDSVTIIPAGSTNNMIDLALSKTANVSTAKAGDAITYTLVIVNNGTEMATGVTVEDLLPSNLTFTGSTASKGSYDETTGIWNVTMLPIGGSATLNIHTTVDAIALPMTNFAQVKTANEEDVDSTPDSNAGTTPNEDDEDSVTILPDNSSEFCDIELTTEFSSSGQPGSSGTLYLNIVNNGPADATDVSVVYDIPNEHFSSTYEVVSKGNLVSGGWDVGDLASGDGAVVIFEGIVQLSTESSVFFAQVETASPQDSDSTPGNDTDQTPDEDDEAKLTFSPSGSTNIDLEANMTSSQANLSLYSNITFTLEVTNNSSIAASGVLAEFPIPSGLAFTSKTVSHGNYNLWSKVWTIGDLQPYETATLNLTLFVLNQSNNKILYAEVIGANESDVDSTPNNGIYQVVAEDDEAAVTVLANSGGGGKNDLSTNIIGKSRLLTVHRMFPVPTQNTVNLIFSSEAETIDINLYDYTGRLLHRQTLEVLPDVNTTQLDLTDFPAGVYYISMETEEGNVRTKVVKQ